MDCLNQLESNPEYQDRVSISTRRYSSIVVLSNKLLHKSLALSLLLIYTLL